jgi:hypothetical protein
VHDTTPLTHVIVLLFPVCLREALWCAARATTSKDAAQKLRNEQLASVAMLKCTTEQHATDVGAELSALHYTLVVAVILSPVRQVCVLTLSAELYSTT